MKIILDANIIIPNFRFDNTALKTVLEASKVGYVSIYIPHVVLDEVYNKFEERLKLAMSNCDQEINNIRRLTNIELLEKSNTEFVTESVGRYKNYVIQLIKEYDITLLSYPQTSHEIIVQKAIKKIKPFSLGEQGYRDALIWENVKSLLTCTEQGNGTNDDEVIFITNNKKDFCEIEKNSTLHEDLIKEIENSGFDSKSIRIVNSIQVFSSEVKLLFDKASSFQETIEQLDMVKLVSANIEQELLNIDLPLYDYQDVAVRNLEKINNLKITDVRVLNSIQYRVDLICDCHMTIDYYVDKSEHRMRGELNYVVEDLDWNDHVIWVSKEIVHAVVVSLIMDDKHQIVSTQIEI